MKFELEIEDSKVDFIINLLKEFSFVKTSKLYIEPTDDVQSFSEAVEELKLVKKGTLKTRPAQDFLNEL